MIAKMYVSNREAAVIALAAQGLVDKEIAIQLEVQPVTVRTYWDRVRKRCNMTRTEVIVAYATASLQQRIADLEAENKRLKSRLAANRSRMAGADAHPIASSNFSSGLNHRARVLAADSPSASIE